MPSGVFTLKQVEQAISQGAWTNQPPNSLNYLVVAGGGGGGSQSNTNSFGGGGGAGGLLQGSILTTAGTSYTVTIGSGGTASANAVGTVGGNSVFGPITANGGGYGGRFGDAGAGGSGGGNGNVAFTVPTTSGGQGISGQGNRGGNSTPTQTTTDAAGGGGGAGAVGLNGGSGVGGNGGAGIASDISGSRATYAGGGGGSGYSTQGAGGAGGGGAAAIDGVATSGSGNTGGGGGGGGRVSSNGTGGSGGSGVVIVSYPGTTQWFTGGTLSYGNGNIVHTFYSSGTLAPTTPSTYVDTGYQISRSLRFNSADSAYLSRTPASAGNRKTWTWSAWVKRSRVSPGYQQLFGGGVGSGANDGLFFSDSDSSLNYFFDGSTFTLITSAQYRDPSAWYHIVLAVDTTQATASDRVKLYVNGSQVTAFASTSYPSQNADSQYINTTNQQRIGAHTNAGYFFSGYMTEVNFIDGQALTPQSFGYYNPDTGVWAPLKFVGTYGTNGFYLNFSDNSNTTAATLGKDYSGNGNNWTPNNFSVSAGAGNDSLVDSPTAYGTDTGVGGTVRGNYCTWNSALPAFSGIVSLSNGNLDATTSTGGTTGQNTYGTYALSSGKWYWEATFTQSGSSSFDSSVGWATTANDSTSAFYGYLRNGQKVSLGTVSSYGASYTSGDVIGIALDLDAGTMTFYKNGVSQGTAFTGLSGSLIPTARMIRESSYTSAWTANFGQRPFAYTAPSGFLALCTQNLPTPTIGATTATQANKYFNIALYAGNNGTQAITGLGFQPDLVWAKDRTSPFTHITTDVLRGVGKSLYPSSTDAEVTNDSNGYLSAFGSDGFTVTAGSSSALRINGSGDNYVGWAWRANGSGVTNTAGSITSTVSANTTSGFSVVTYTGTGVNATVGHGLGVAPSMIIVKVRNTGTQDWQVYHSVLGINQAIQLNQTSAASSASNYWFNGVTASVFGVNGSYAGINGSGNTYVAYCFAEVPGYSRFGSFVGNGSTDGPFVYCGFRPRWIMYKDASATNVWVIVDTARQNYNVMGPYLLPNSSDAEGTGTIFDILSNGFKVRVGTSSLNTSGNTIIFAAFAESPFKYSIAR